MTEKISLIEQKLLAIDPTQYQMLCLDFLVRKYPILKEYPREYGKTIGADKVRKGFLIFIFHYLMGSEN